MAKTIANRIASLSPCSVAAEWAAGYTSAATAWAECERGDWMLWLLGKLSGEPESDSRRKLVLCACECARLALKHVAKGETRPLKAIETVERWARREKGVTLEDVRAAAADAAADAAAYAAYAAADAAYAAADAAAYAAYAAADAAYAAAAYAAAYAAYAAADAAYAAAAYAAADAAYAAAYAAAADARHNARAKTLKRCADIVRKHYPKPPVMRKAVAHA